MERLDAHVGSMKAALQQTPEVLHRIGVDFTIDVRDGMIDDFVLKLREPLVGLQGVRKQRGACQDVLAGRALEHRPYVAWERL